MAEIRRLSMDALILMASRDVRPKMVLSDSRLNSALAGAAYRIGFLITEKEARAALGYLKEVLKRGVRENKCSHELTGFLAGMLRAILVLPKFRGTIFGESSVHRAPYFHP